MVPRSRNRRDPPIRAFQVLNLVFLMKKNFFVSRQLAVAECVQSSDNSIRFQPICSRAKKAAGLVEDRPYRDEDVAGEVHLHKSAECSRQKRFQISARDPQIFCHV